MGLADARRFESRFPGRPFIHLTSASAFKDAACQRTDQLPSRSGAVQTERQYRSGRFIDPFGQFEVACAEAAYVMRGELNADGVVDIEPLGVVIHPFRDQGHLGHESEGFDKVLEFQDAGEFAVFNGPITALGQQLVNFRLSQPSRSRHDELLIFQGNRHLVRARDGSVQPVNPSKTLAAFTPSSRAA